jgi:hypothetical protein
MNKTVRVKMPAMNESTVTEVTMAQVAVTDVTVADMTMMPVAVVAMVRQGASRRNDRDCRHRRQTD